MKVLIIIAYLLGAYVTDSLASYAARKPKQCKDSISSAEMEAFVNEAKNKPNGDEQITYDLYTPKNVKNRQILRTGDEDALHDSNFNPDWPVRFSIQGWTGKSTSCSNTLIKDAYLSTGKFNVILVDWSSIALNIDSRWVEKQLPKVAADIAKFIRFLQQKTNVEMHNIYLIGHSTGCHISGLVGKYLKPHKLGAIVALDPSELKQRGQSADFHLAPNDALYVESIHTDASYLLENRIELSQASFFPNWGQNQPHCAEATESQVYYECDNFAAVHYFAESLRHPKLFGAIKCPNLSSILENNNCECSSGSDECRPDVYMGGEPLVRKTGLFYLSTSPNTPYGLGHVAIRKVIKPSTEFAGTLFS